MSSSIRWFLIAAIVVLSTCSLVADAANFSLSVKRDKRRVIDLGVFGYSGQGNLVLKLKDFVLHDVSEYTTADEKIGFTLDLVTSASAARQELSYSIKETKKDQGEDVGNLCFVDDPTIAPKERFSIALEEVLNKAASEKDEDVSSFHPLLGAAAPPVAPPPVAEGKEGVKQTEQKLRKALTGMTTTIQIPEAKEGLYALFFYNCKKLNKNKDPLLVSFSVEVSQYRVMDVLSGVRNYLSAGDAPLPFMYFIAFLVFLGGAIWWHRLLFHSGPEVYNSIRSVHQFMYALAVLKVMVLFFHAVMLYRRQVNGRMHGSWALLYYFFQTIKGIALFALIALLGTGWSLLKPFLTKTDQRILMLVLPLQVLGNIAQAVIDEQSEGSSHWGDWRGALRIFDVACCCAVLLPIVWSIRSLRDSSTGTKAAQRSLNRLRQFRTFYIASVGFIYFTRIALEFLTEYLSFRHLWVGSFLYEVSAVLYYGYVGWLFQPKAEVRGRLVVDEDAEEVDGNDVASGVQDIELEDNGDRKSVV